MPAATWPHGTRAILHVDMDAFYASVEQREHPELKGKPVIVGGPKDARGVVSAASYEARAFGVHSAMPLRNAAHLCPHGHFLPVRMKLYLRVSDDIFEIFRHYSPLVEPLSVDEAFLDMTGCERLFQGPVEAARRIRAEIRATCDLTASVGVARNKFLAKIASDLDKPDGLTVVPPDRVEEFLAPLEVERMWGIGPKGAEVMHRHGVRTFADLARAPDSTLRRAFGMGAETLRLLARGVDARSVVTARAPKSVGHETTFPEDVDDPATIHSTLVALVDQVASRLRRHGLKAGRVTLKLRYVPWRTVTRQTTLAVPTAATGILLETVLRLYDEKASGTRTPLRLVGVSTSGFSAQAVLFHRADAEREEAVDRAVDEVRRKFGRGAVRRGSAARWRPRPDAE